MVATPDIPKAFHYVWMGKDFPYFCWLSVAATVRLHPGAPVYIWVHGDVPKVPNFARLRTLPGVEIRPIELEPMLAARSNGDALRALFAGIPERAYSAKSNLLRYLILHREGGVYLDFDTLMLRSMDPLLTGPKEASTGMFKGAFVGTEAVWRHDMDRVRGKFHPAMAVSAAGFGVSFALRRAGAALTGKPGPLGWLAAGLRGAGKAVMPVWSALMANNAVLGDHPGGFLGQAARAGPRPGIPRSGTTWVRLL